MPRNPVFHWTSSGKLATDVLPNMQSEAAQAIEDALT